MKTQNFLIGLILVLLSVTQVVIGQIRAVTENGDSIYVYDNGTWSFELLDQMPEEENVFDYLSTELQIDTANAEYSFPANAKKEVTNKRGQFTLKYNSSSWTRVPPATLNGEAEFAFQSKETDIWSVVISEVTPISTDVLFRIAKKTMDENSGAKAKIIKTEIRKVNGKNILRGVLHAEVSGISFIFDSYYYSNDLGSVQFVTWTSEPVWEKNEDKIHDLLNGLVIN